MSSFLKKLFSGKKSKNRESSPKSSGTIEPLVLTRDAHCISRKLISKNALKVLYRLNDAGYQSYLVGGGVRDILLGLRPKDFDIATDATPEEIAKLFRNCRLIGRRFRLAHILFGREVIEVATFRAPHDLPATTSSSKYRHKKNEKSRTSNQGMLVRDNVYGSLEDDAFRRDFTVNALYYTVKNFSVIDYVGGLEDLAERKLKLIGDPKTRYTEDPVRMLRAVRLACKLNLAIEESTASPIKKMSSLLENISPARLWDESNKLLLAGYAKSTWQSLIDYQLAKYLFPQTLEQIYKSKDDPETSKFLHFINAALKNTDLRIKNEQPVTPAFLYAVFLWLPQQRLASVLNNKGLPYFESQQKAASKIITTQCQSISIPKRFSMVIKDIWMLQTRLPNLRKKNVDRVIAHPKFRAGYDFLCLRAGDDPSLKSLADWWTEYQKVDTNQRLKMLKSHQPKASKRQRNRRKPKNRMRKDS